MSPADYAATRCGVNGRLNGRTNPNVATVASLLLSLLRKYARFMHHVDPRQAHPQLPRKLGGFNFLRVFGKTMGNSRSPGHGRLFFDRLVLGGVKGAV